MGEQTCVVVEPVGLPPHEAGERIGPEHLVRDAEAAATRHKVEGDRGRDPGHERGAGEPFLPLDDRWIQAVAVELHDRLVVQPKDLSEDALGEERKTLDGNLPRLLADDEDLVQPGELEDAPDLRPDVDELDAAAERGEPLVLRHNDANPTARDERARAEVEDEPPQLRVRGDGRGERLGGGRVEAASEAEGGSRVGEHHSDLEGCHAGALRHAGNQRLMLPASAARGTSLSHNGHEWLFPNDMSAKGASATVRRVERTGRSDSRGWSGWMRSSLGGAKEFPIQTQDRIFPVGSSPPPLHRAYFTTSHVRSSSSCSSNRTVKRNWPLHSGFQQLWRENGLRR